MQELAGEIFSCIRKGGMSQRLALRIQERMARLTASEQKLGQEILKRQGVVETHSATELARMAGVSKATAARFFRSLGYADFEEVKAQAREERNRTQPYSYSVAASEKIVLGRAIGDHLALEISNLTRTFEEMRSDRLTAAAELIFNAPRLWFSGAGAEDSLARHGLQQFAKLRSNVALLNIADGALADDLAMMGPRDAVVVVTIAPRPRAIRSVLSYAKTTRANVITITDHASLSSVQRFSDVVLPCHVAGFGLAPSHTGLFSALRLLAVAFLARAGDTALQRADIIASIQEELDDTP